MGNIPQRKSNEEYMYDNHKVITNDADLRINTLEYDDDEKKVVSDDGLKKMIENDTASRVKCHERFLILGMESGTVYVLDSYGDILKQYRAHNSAVNDISIDENGDHIATCSSDGRVVIRDISKDVETCHHFRNQDLLCVQLNPNFATSPQFVTCVRGGQQHLILRSIGLFRSDNKMLHGGEGPISCISWKYESIAWANDRGVKIFDISDHEPIAHINKSNHHSSDPARYKCCLCWENSETLLIGWGNCVKVCKIRSRIRVRDGKMVKEAFCYRFFTDFYICGIAPFKQHILLLHFDAGKGKNKKELTIVNRKGERVAANPLAIYNNYYNELLIDGYCRMFGIYIPNVVVNVLKEWHTYGLMHLVDAFSTQNGALWKLCVVTQLMADVS